MDDPISEREKEVVKTNSKTLQHGINITGIERPREQIGATLLNKTIKSAINAPDHHEEQKIQRNDDQKGKNVAKFGEIRQDAVRTKAKVKKVQYKELVTICPIPLGISTELN
jgi:hypothetical protein